MYKHNLDYFSIFFGYVETFKHIIENDAYYAVRSQYQANNSIM
jgi:hypothetical protein